MNTIEKMAKEKYGSVHKMLKIFGLRPGTIYPVLGGYRKSWPRLRAQMSQILGAEEDSLFDPHGWPRKEEVRDGHKA